MPILFVEILICVVQNDSFLGFFSNSSAEIISSSPLSSSPQKVSQMPPKKLPEVPVFKPENEIELFSGSDFEELILTDEFSYDQ